VVKRVAAMLMSVGLVLAGLAVTATPAAAASYSFESCQQSGTGTPPAGLDQITVDVTGTAPAEAESGAFLIVADVVVTLHNPHPYAIDTNGGVSITVPAPAGANPNATEFFSPSGLSIPAGGSSQFHGSLQYITTGSAGTVLGFRPSMLTFYFGAGLSVSCDIASGSSAFASTLLIERPGYQFSCTILGLTLQQTIDVVGNAPSSVEHGSTFALADVVTTSTAPIDTVVQSVTFTLETPANATPVSPLSITTPGPFVVPAGVPFNSAPTSFDFVASGPVGSVVEFRPSSIVTQTNFGTVSCTAVPGQEAFATTTITAPVTDQIAIGAVGFDGQLKYAHHAALSSGGFDLTRNGQGTLTALQGEGTFVGPDGGDASLRVRYERPWTKLRLVDSNGVALRASSLLPVVSPTGSDFAVGVAFGELNHQPVLVIWVVRDTG